MRPLSPHQWVRRARPLARRRARTLRPFAGSHTLAEAVLLGALALLGLIGTKHGGHLLVQVQTTVHWTAALQTGVPVQQQGLFRLRSVHKQSRKKGQKDPLSQDSVTYYRLRNPAVSTTFLRKILLIFFNFRSYSQYLVYFLSHIHNSQILL